MAVEAPAPSKRLNSETFFRTIPQALDVDLREDSPHRQLLSDEARNLYIIAGPGTGKTTALALLVLRALFLDRWPPTSIRAPPVTGKAAAELRSRISRGVFSTLEAVPELGDPTDPEYDIAALRIGTIDEICQQACLELELGAVVDEVVQNGTMRAAIFRSGLFSGGQERRAQIVKVLQPLFGDARSGLSLIRDRLVSVNERIGQDLVDQSAWLNRRRRFRPLAKVLEKYRELLDGEGRLDFTSLETTFLSELDGRLSDWKDPVRVLLVDEYQDTNPLQEAIYRQLSKHAVGNGGWIALVGDDDQSLFRFRGATVDLFVKARSRYKRLEQASLDVNHRSTRPIVAFANEFVAIDPRYQRARAEGKPSLQPAKSRDRWRDSDRIPVLGMFRADVPSLSEAVSSAVEQVVRERWIVPGKTGAVGVEQPGDVAVIAQSTRQFSRGGIQRLFGYLEADLLMRGIKVFNPRGKDVGAVLDVQKLLGLSLMCLDAVGDLLPDRAPYQAHDRIVEWRDAALEFMRTNPEPRKPHGLARFVKSWQKRNPQGRERDWPRTFPFMELLHELSVWIPSLRESPGILYTEAITRTVDEIGTLFGPRAVLIPKDHWESTVGRLYWEFFIPLALDEVDVDEEVLELLPIDAVNMLTVHQAKGLEFPVVFVDVGSGFKRNHPAQAFQRFPREDAVFAPYTLEDEFRDYSELPRVRRAARDRAFDDLVRTFFVAFTRAQHILVLMGLGDPEEGPLEIANVATGWTRHQDPRWSELGVELV